ncbi:MAG: hypothetical protein Q4E62_02205 [Sutterellaceae bacterium]|nr:hypothetical protein [Sutterellaceae bacterium]
MRTNPHRQHYWSESLKTDYPSYPEWEETEPEDEPIMLHRAFFDCHTGMQFVWGKEPRIVAPKAYIERLIKTFVPDGAKVAFTQKRFEHVGPMHDTDDGIKTSLVDGDELYDVTLGLDFGTSGVKVVINDRRRKYAVPFNQRLGIDAYVLPTTVWLDNEDNYNIDGIGDSLSDIKLGLMDNTQDPMYQYASVAFLALAIRAARAYLFIDRKDLWQLGKIVWSCAIGVPSDHYESNLTKFWERILKAAWAVACEDEPVSYDLVQDAFENWKEYDVDCDIYAIPEFAAQVLSLAATQEQTDGAQFYILADVGAGTVDVCAFSVFRPHWDGINDRGYKVTQYAARVRDLGTANCHKQRIRWWHDYIENFCYGRQDTLEALLQKLEDEYILLPTTILPGSGRDYVNLEIPPEIKSCDEEFFESFVGLVSGDIKRSLKEHGELSYNELDNLKVCLCGGGSRCDQYKQTLINATHKNISSYANRNVALILLKSDILFDERFPVLIGDHHRLSVAYGLSDPQEIEAIDKYAQHKRSYLDRWHDTVDVSPNYISKDMM